MEIQKVLCSNEATENESDFVISEVRSSHSNSEEIKTWDRNVIAALELASKVNPFMPDFIHGQERNSTFPFPESCPIFMERDRNAVPIRKGGKEWERKGD